MRYAWFGGNVIKIKAAKGEKNGTDMFLLFCPYLEKESGNEWGLRAFFGQFRVIYFCECFNFGNVSVLFKFLAEQIRVISIICGEKIRFN